ncbi:FtsW/RodA/SpoVE family cell cycle protein [uncultured Caulobacter sp.]|uniref:FtsW/RodA/SpoVE family cell cycle protein n=1 Tax=uncultured Caulobacter sp. TaxID=158749 RepID=UPI00263A3A26|nr:FtsW/RodA/SpoVE family cell cycle protein [uncultured Caulobacter sp.]
MPSAYRFPSLQVLLTLVASILAIRAAGGSGNAMVLQGGAGLVGALVAWGVAVRAGTPGRLARWAVPGLALAVEAYVLTAGVSMEGVRRWIALGPVQLHAASLLVPLAIWATAGRLEPIAAAMLAGLMVVLALQPDAASVLALTLGVAVGLVDRSRAPRLVAALTALGLACAGYAFSRHDPLPAVAHVERVIPNAFAASPPVGIFAALALAALPLAMLWTRRSLESAALAAVWLGFLLANLIANYPAPVIGAGAAPVIGWLLSIGLALGRGRENVLRADDPVPTG